MNDITQVLSEIESGEIGAVDKLLPLVYEELKALAAAKLADERAGHSLQATALVHEAYLRLVGNASFENRGHFFASAAKAMRRILVNHARDRKRIKRGGDRIRVELLDQAESLSGSPELVLSLDELLGKLGEEDPSSAQLAVLHLFGGMSIDEAAKAMQLSRATAYRNWKYARAWLRAALTEEEK